jgi:hypothetical protein
MNLIRARDKHDKILYGDCGDQWIMIVVFSLSYELGLNTLLVPKF